MKRKNSLDYVSVVFPFYTLLVIASALALLVSLFPILFPDAPGKEILQAVIQASITLGGAYLGWYLANKGEKEKQQREIDIKVSAIREELRDLHSIMLGIVELNLGHAKYVAAKPKNKFHNYTMEQSSPAYDEYFKNIIPFVSPEFRQNIKTIFNTLKNYNETTNYLGRAIGDTNTPPEELLLNFHACYIIAGKIVYMCKWLDEFGENKRIDLNSDFFKPFKEMDQSNALLCRLKLNLKQI